MLVRVVQLTNTKPTEWSTLNALLDLSISSAEMGDVPTVSTPIVATANDFLTPT